MRTMRVAIIAETIHWRVYGPPMQVFFSMFATFNSYFERPNKAFCCLNELGDAELQYILDND